MDGIVTRVAEEATDPAFDVAFYEVKDVTGRRTDPLASAVNMVSCHGDSSRAEDDDLRTVDAEGRPATRDRPYFDWGYVCPTHEAYRQELLDLVTECNEASPDVRLDDVGFARDGYCRCKRCLATFESAETDDWWAWRDAVVTDFVRSAVDRIDGRTYLTVHPDPYPGHLNRRSGLDLESVEPLVDEVVVPLYDLAYATTYWLEVIASGFADALTSADLGIELYGIDIDLDNLVHAAEVADHYASSLYIAYDADTAQAVAERLE